MTNALPVILTGVTGKMGSTLLRALQQDRGLQLTGATERPGSQAIGLDAGAALGLSPLGVTVTDDLSPAIAAGKARVVIDFTSAEASLVHAGVCSEQGVALVIGSTGFSAQGRAELSRWASRIPVVMSPNMSVGVNLIIQVARQLAQVLGESFDVEIVETHHRMKRDAPSGTALRLAEEIASSLGRSSADFRTARQGEIGSRPRGEIGIQALRGGDVVGEHTVLFLGEGERVELTHRAHSREQFANGALRAARWVVGQPPGLYDMQDVLGLRAPGS